MPFGIMVVWVAYSQSHAQDWKEKCDMKRFVVTGLVAMLMLAGTMVQAADAEETGLSDAQKDMLRALARGDVKPWPPTTAVQLGGLHEKAATQWDVLHRDMLPHG